MFMHHVRLPIARLPALVFEFVVFVFAFVRLWTNVADTSSKSFNLLKVRRKTASLMDLILRDTMFYFTLFVHLMSQM